MKEKILKDWSEFEQELRDLRSYRQTLIEADEYAHVPDLLFRGQSNESWALETTLERYEPNITTWLGYFRLASATRAQVESLTTKKWDFPEFDVLDEWSRTSSGPWLSSPPGYSYLVYLRHHGFPSPLLDWSRSPYVAAFFAFRGQSTSNTAIYAYLETTGLGKSAMGGTPTIQTQGPYVTSHARHVLQQCEYSVCGAFVDKEWRITKHEDVFADDEADQDLLWKFTLPAGERLRVLRQLDDYNLNAFSLFQTEDALLETVALREIDFSRRFTKRRSKISEAEVEAP